jgi:transcription initiation factor TFIIIB Brf1 subunit/transcription initiation factor TFIIB
MVMGNPRMKLRVVNGWMRWVYREKTFFNDTKLMEQKCYAARIGQSVLDSALYLYKKIAETKKIIRGVRRQGTMAACVYYGAQRQGISYKPEEIARAFGIDRKVHSKGRATVNELLMGLETSFSPSAGVGASASNTSASAGEGVGTSASRSEFSSSSSPPHHRVAEFAGRFCNDLGLGREAAAIACTLSLNLGRLEVAENFQPASVATAVVLLLQNIPAASTLPRVKGITRAQLSEAFGISVATIAKAQRAITPWLATAADNDATDAYLRRLLS